VCLLKQMAGIAAVGKELTEFPQGVIPEGVAGIPKGFVSGFGLKLELKPAPFKAANIFGNLACASVYSFPVKEKVQDTGGARISVNTGIGATLKVGGFVHGAGFALGRIARLIGVPPEAIK
jgi:4-hydroxybenzoate polyprenyltransferase